MVRERIEATPVRGFLVAADIPGSRRAVECELSRQVAKGELVRARKGVYWKGPKTRVGMPRPRPGDLALVVAGPGAGPAELSAAHLLGLTTQVPAIEVIAVPGRTPMRIPGVRFVSRSIERRIHDLRPVEVAVLEVLRGGPRLVETEWTEVGAVIKRLATSAEIRPELLTEQVHHEHSLATRNRWFEIAKAIGSTKWLHGG